MNWFTEDNKAIAVVGPQAYKRLKNLLAPIKPSTKTFTELWTLLAGHYKPKPLIIAERFCLYKRQQKEGESEAEFAVCLRQTLVALRIWQFSE